MEYNRNNANAITDEISKNPRLPRLDEVVILLFQNQIAQQTEFREIQRTLLRIEKDVEQLKTIVLRHEEMLAEIIQVLARLPESIQQRTGFKKR